VGRDEVVERKLARCVASNEGGSVGVLHWRVNPTLALIRFVIINHTMYHIFFSRGRDPA
jgi:hypothetical protein